VSTKTVKCRYPEQLVNALLKGIVNAVRKAFHLYLYPASPEEIEDNCQQIILLLIDDDYRRLCSYDSDKSSFQTWLTIVVRHHISNYIQRQKKMSSIDDLSPDSLISQPSQEATLILESERQILQEVINQLSQREQELLEFFFKERLTVEEVAIRMGMKVNSVYRRKHAVIQKIRMYVRERSMRPDD
jgi:RNA polymerase sigma factor (sigma-70 family)